MNPPHVTQSLDDRDYFLDNVVDLRLRRKAADTETERGVRHIFGSTKSAEDI